MINSYNYVVSRTYQVISHFLNREILFYMKLRRTCVTPSLLFRSCSNRTCWLLLLQHHLTLCYSHRNVIHALSLSLSLNCWLGSLKHVCYCLVSLKHVLCKRSRTNVCMSKFLCWNPEVFRLFKRQQICRRWNMKNWKVEKSNSKDLRDVHKVALRVLRTYHKFTHFA